MKLLDIEVFPMSVGCALVEKMDVLDMYSTVDVGTKSPG